MILSRCQPDAYGSCNTTRRCPLDDFGQVRVHVLYKRAEIPANKAIPAFAGFSNL
jgi:hypothetical protein